MLVILGLLVWLMGQRAEVCETQTGDFKGANLESDQLSYIP